MISGMNVNLRGGLVLIRKSMLGWMASKGFFWTLTLGWMVSPVVFMFMWIVAAGKDSIGGFDRSDFVFYYICLMLVNQLTYPTCHWTVGENIQIGTMSSWLLKPLPVIYNGIAGDISGKVVCMPFIFLICVVLGLFLGFRVDLTVSTMLLSLLALVLAQVLRFMLAYTLALFAFWTQKIGSLLSINDTLVFLLAGQAAPTALLPGFLKTASEVLPFRYMLGFPVEIVSGKLKTSEILQGFILQIIWVAAVLLLQNAIWKKGVRHYTAVGG